MKNLWPSFNFEFDRTVFGVAIIGQIPEIYIMLGPFNLVVKWNRREVKN